ncbi:MAG TPA: bifunctional demethylmenaquinone methyltransferase/2-methoxy-6-polyprenyl-1,4-benzoquinol methylase UbiE [Ignavibacteriaceae bacterium]
MIEKKKEVKKIFDSIAWRYDLLNHLLSFGMDIYWRKKAIKITGLSSESILLDVACGTGDVAIEARKQGAINIFGADYSFEMLKLFEKKSGWIKKRTVQMVAENLPVKDESVSNITVAFGVRNFYDIQEGFNSFYRILKREGKATIIEFRLPSNPFLKGLYKFYFKKILPAVGGLISGNREAYKYLPRSVEEFDEKINMPELLRNAGFRKIEVYSLTFGIVQTIIAAK